jgi:hypothetical protein
MITARFTHIFLHFIILTIHGQEYKARSSTLSTISVQSVQHSVLDDPRYTGLFLPWGEISSFATIHFHKFYNSIYVFL